MMKLTDRRRVVWYLLAAAGALLIRYGAPYLGSVYLAALFRKTGALAAQNTPGWAVFLDQNGSALILTVCAAALASISVPIGRDEPGSIPPCPSLGSLGLGFFAGAVAAAAGAGIFIALDMARVVSWDASASLWIAVFARAVWVAAATSFALSVWGKVLRGGAVRVLISALLLAALLGPAGSGAIGVVGPAVFALFLSLARRRFGWTAACAAGWCAAQEAVRIMSGTGGMLHVSETWLTGGARPMSGLFWIVCFAACCALLIRDMLPDHPAKAARRLGQDRMRQ